MTSPRLCIAVFGGTFDPIHLGHLQLAAALKTQLQCAQMRLMPAHVPPHRNSPQVSASERACMVQLALQDYPSLQLDDRELNRSTPSYTVDSLRELRAELGGEVSLSFVMGMDSLNQLDRWHQWQALTQLAHLVVLARPGQEWPAANSALGQWLQPRLAPPAALQEAACGAVVLMEPALLPVSASEIRTKLAAGQDVSHWLTPAVADYIRSQQLYSTLNQD